MADHDKPVWFITGCSTGFGRELARLLLAQGYRVAATARDAASLADLQAGNPNALALALDVTKSEAITQAVRAAEEKFGTGRIANRPMAGGFIQLQQRQALPHRNHVVIGDRIRFHFDFEGVGQRGIAARHRARNPHHLLGWTGLALAGSR